MAFHSPVLNTALKRLISPLVASLHTAHWQSAFRFATTGRIIEPTAVVPFTDKASGK
ncbi:MAG: hypothetical protein LBK01_03710 [Burkholderiaceae bacterium]|nr:hypothetical protein [Burkholderiaceae bacterium]